MHAKVEKRSQLRTVDLALGRRWWLLPLVGLVPLAALVAWTEFAAPGSLFFSVAVETASAGWSFGALSTVAAVLNQHGARLRHRLASVLTIALAVVILNPTGGPPGGWIVIFTSLSLTQVAAVRLIGSPRWYVQPTTKENSGASLLFLLGITGMAAAVFAAVARSVDLMDVGLWHMMLLILLACLFGQVVSAVPSHGWAVLGGGAGIAAILILLAVGSTGVMSYAIWNPALSVASAYCSSWAIGFFHRCDPMRTTAAAEPTIAA